MPTTLTRPDGLYILTQSKLSKLATDETLGQFAAGIIPTALSHVAVPPDESWTLATALHHLGPPSNPLLAVLLVLDAEVIAIVADERRIFPLPAFLAYRTSLPPDQYPLHTIRLPPLNQGGHYCFIEAGDEAYLAARLDLHSTLKVAGHVRIATSSPTRSPQRLQAVEHRLERQILDRRLIETTVSGGNEELSVPLSRQEAEQLIDILTSLVE